MAFPSLLLAFGLVHEEAKFGPADAASFLFISRMAFFDGCCHSCGSHRICPAESYPLLPATTR